MDTREIIRTLMLSDFYFTVPVAERWGMIQRLKHRCLTKPGAETEAGSGADPGAGAQDRWPTA